MTGRDGILSPGRIAGLTPRGPVAIDPAGRRLGETFGKRMEIVGGLILLAIGIRVLITHLGG